MMLRSQSRDFLKRVLSESGRAKAIFSLCRGNAEPASTRARVSSHGVIPSGGVFGKFVRTDCLTSS
jgi:hypothetical protein